MTLMFFVRVTAIPASNGREIVQRRVRSRQELPRRNPKSLRLVPFTISRFRLQDARSDLYPEIRACLSRD